MKSLKKFLKGLMGNIDNDKIENYYGHGAHNHDHGGHSHNGDNEHQPANKYKCPKNCEGNKVYDNPGNCPVCNMKLMPVNDKHHDTKDNDAPHNEEHHHGHKH